MISAPLSFPPITEEKYAGRHLILDVWGGQHFSCAETLKGLLKEMAEVAGATVLRIDLHSFQENGGVTGVAMLAESHISVHTWPEYSYAAFDIFMCGKCDPYKSLQTLEERLLPAKTEITEIKRGRIGLSNECPAAPSCHTSPKRESDYIRHNSVPPDPIGSLQSIDTFG